MIILLIYGRDSIFQRCISFNMVIITSIGTKAIILMNYQYIIQSSLLNWQLHHVAGNDRKDYKESSKSIRHKLLHYVTEYKAILSCILWWCVMMCNDDVCYDFPKLNTIQYTITTTRCENLLLKLNCLSAFLITGIANEQTTKSQYDFAYVEPTRLYSAI